MQLNLPLCNNSSSISSTLLYQDHPVLAITTWIFHSTYYPQYLPLWEKSIIFTKLFTTPKLASKCFFFLNACHSNNVNCSTIPHKSQIPTKTKTRTWMCIIIHLIYGFNIKHPSRLYIVLTHHWLQRLINEMV